MFGLWSASPHRSPPSEGPAKDHLPDHERSHAILSGMTEWLLARTRLIEIVVGLGLGGIFLVKGLTALL